MSAYFRNGSIFRDSVPLWKEATGCGPLRDVCTRVNVAAVYRNGSISRDSVPLWKQ